MRSVATLSIGTASGPEAFGSVRAWQETQVPGPLVGGVGVGGGGGGGAGAGAVGGVGEARAQIGKDRVAPIGAGALGRRDDGVEPGLDHRVAGTDRLFLYGE